ncbi:MAG: hypothetical protein AAF748_01010 [Pseudomonadota bacterium]
MRKEFGFNDLLLILEKERTAIIEANFSAIKSFNAEKSRLLDTMSPDDMSEAELGVLKLNLQRNQELLMSVQRGLADAKGFIKNIRASAKLRTYGATGFIRVID